MKKKALFYECNGNPVYEYDMYYVIDNNNKIITYLANKDVPEQDDCLCFKYYRDARDMMLKFEMEEIVNNLKANLDILFFNHELGISPDIQNKIQSLYILSKRIRIKQTNLLLENN